MSNLTKREIITQIYDTTHFPQKEVHSVVQMTLDILMNSLAAVCRFWGTSRPHGIATRDRRTNPEVSW
jgi:hypothetical protein